MIRVDIKKTKIFKEMDIEESKRFFDATRSKYVHRIDNLYYSVWLCGDVKCTKEENKNEKVERLIEDLNLLKREMIENNLDIDFFGLSMKRKRHEIFDLCLSSPGEFDIIFSQYLPNSNTNRIHIQLRALGIWLYGIDSMLKKSYEKLKEILSFYELRIKEIKENRIDYCFHTNSIQSPQRYFSDNMLDCCCKHNFVDEFKHRGKEGKNMVVDYLTFGNRNSVCIFIRIYNKVKEIIEMNYKSSIIEIWYKNGLISLYDKFIYEYCYELKSYRSVCLAQCEFYLKFGKDENIKSEIRGILKKYSTNLIEIEKYVQANKLLPKPTLILNIEFETHRKFYKQCDKFIFSLNTNNDCEYPLKRIYKILDNRKYFIEYLTDNSLKFVDSDGQYLDFWKRLRSLRLNCCTEVDCYKLREYSRSLEKKKVCRQAVLSIAALSLYINKNYSDSFDNDIYDFLTLVNDNDLDSNSNFTYKDYDLIKLKKYKNIKPLLNTEKKKSRKLIPELPNSKE